MINNNLFVQVSIEGFYEQFPEFNKPEYVNICPNALNVALCRIKPINKGALRNECRIRAIYLLTAHESVLALKRFQNASTQAGQVASATVDGVSVSYVQIPAKWLSDYYLGLTSYGLELLSMLDDLTAVPSYRGGSFERVF